MIFLHSDTLLRDILVFIFILCPLNSKKRLIQNDVEKLLALFNYNVKNNNNQNKVIILFKVFIR